MYCQNFHHFKHPRKKKQQETSQAEEGHTRVPSFPSFNWTQSINQSSNQLDLFSAVKFLGQRSLVSKTLRFQKKLSFHKFRTQEIVRHRFRETNNEKITRRTIGAHGYNFLQNELSLAILQYNMLSNNRYLVPSFAIL